MKKLFPILLFIVTLVAVSSSCSKTETYADSLKKERRAINRFLNNNDIEVLTQIPADSIFAENQYLRDSNTGVYFRVINWGTGDTIRRGTDVYLRYYDNIIEMTSGDTLNYLLNGNAPSYWIDLTYGKESTYIVTTYTSTASIEFFKYGTLSPACVLPLKYKLRNGGQVSIIIPFSSGSGYQSSSYTPFYYERVNYTFHNDIIPGE